MEDHVKYTFNFLEVELTRRCNLQCVHCMKGDAQNIDITPQIIDRIFEDVEACESIAFIGGEPLLQLDMMEYFIEKLIASHWRTKHIQLTTNGTILDLRVFNIFFRFLKSNPERRALIRISNDQYHNQSESRKSMDFYSFLADQKPELQVEFCGDIDRLRIAGRAIDYVKSHPDTETCGRQTIYGHRIKIVDNKVLCGIQIAANGNIGFTDERDYETDDTFAIGNILNDSLSNVIKRNNTNCLLTCAESKALDIARDTEYLFKSTGKFDHTFMNLLRFKNAEILIPQIISLRGEAHKMYPYVPAQEIISAFYFPTRSGMFNYLIDGMIKMLKKSPVTIADVKRTVEPSLYRIWISEEAPNKGADDCANVLMFLLGHLRTFGTGDYLREYYSDAFKTIEALNEKYANGELVWDNSHNFDCK